jgi:hypothetical protein
MVGLCVIEKSQHQPCEGFIAGSRARGSDTQAQSWAEKGILVLRMSKGESHVPPGVYSRGQS